MRKSVTTIVSVMGATCIAGLAVARSQEPVPNPNPTIPSSEAQAAHENVLDEIVITAARKRSEDVQRTPVAITAISAKMLEANHINNFFQVAQLVPNLSMVKSGTAAGVTNIYLRGFGSNSNDPSIDPRVSIYIDGIYMPAAVGSLFDTFDLGQVEVQAGPQGTLLGKNSPIGAIYVTSASPTTAFDGEVQAEYGSYDRFASRLRLNVPLIQDGAGNNVLATRFSVVENQGGSWVYNYATGKRDEGGLQGQSGRIALVYTPDSPFKWDLRASLAKDNNPQPDQVAANFAGSFSGNQDQVTQGFPNPCNPAVAPASLCRTYPYGTTDNPFTDRSRDNFELLSSTMSYRFDAVTLTSVTGLTSFWLDDSSNVGGTPYVALVQYHDRTRFDEETEELRLSSNKNGGLDLDGRLDWVLGGYFSNYSYGYTNALGSGASSHFTLPFGAINIRQAQTGITQSEALFGRAIYNFTDDWTGTFGVRQSWDHKTHGCDGPVCSPSDPTRYSFDVPIGSHDTSFEFGTAYQFDEHHLAYVRFAQGYATGGYGGFSIGKIYKPEHNDDYEIGIKSDWLDKRLRANIDLFHNDLSQLQVAGALTIPTPPGFLQQTINAASATVEGVEGQFVGLPTPDLTVHLNIGYLHTKYNQNMSTVCSNVVGVNADCSGVPFAYSPKWTIDLGGEYAADLPNDLGTATFGANFVYKSRLFTKDPPYPSSEQNGYGLLNLDLTLRDASEKYAIEFFGSNVLNRAYKLSVGAAGGLVYVTQGPPAMWGVKLSYKFGLASEEAESGQAAYVPPPVAAPTPSVPRSYLVFFDFNKSDLTSQATQIVDQAAANAAPAKVTRIEVTGHTDTVGSDAYNMRLSRRRAESVAAQLEKDGILSSEIEIVAKGKRDLLVPTADGVREPQNRRVQIVYEG